MKKNRILNIIMFLSCFVILLSGVMITKNIKEQVHQDDNDNSYGITKEVEHEVETESPQNSDTVKSTDQNTAQNVEEETSEIDITNRNQIKAEKEQEKIEHKEIKHKEIKHKEQEDEEKVIDKKQLEVNKTKDSSTLKPSMPNKIQKENKEKPSETKKPKQVKENNENETKRAEKDSSPSCYITIRCDTILNNMEDLTKSKKKYVPENGYILAQKKVKIQEKETVFDLLKKVCEEENIQLEYSWTPGYNSYYIEGIHQLYEFDCGSQSGWMYKVNEEFPNYGCSSYELKDGDSVVWCYTCKGLGSDVGSSMK